MHDPSTGRDHEPPRPATSVSFLDEDEDELPDAALDAVVGGVSVEAALARAAAYAAGGLS